MGSEQSRASQSTISITRGTSNKEEAQKILESAAQRAKAYAQHMDEIAETFEGIDRDTTKHFEQSLQRALVEAEESIQGFAQRQLRRRGKELETCRDAIHGRLRATREAVAGLRAGRDSKTGWIGRAGRSWRILCVEASGSREGRTQVSRAQQMHEWGIGLLGVWLQMTDSRTLSLGGALHTILMQETPRRIEEGRRSATYAMECTGGVGNRGRGWWQLSGPLGAAAAVHVKRPSSISSSSSLSPHVDGAAADVWAGASVLVYVVDSQNGRIQVLDGTAMQFVDTLPPDAKEGLTRGQGLLVHPVDLAVHTPTEICAGVHPPTRVAVADSLGNRVVVFTHRLGANAPVNAPVNAPANRPSIYRRGGEAFVSGCSHGSNFVAPRAVCFTQTGDVIVADGGFGPRIHCFRLPDEFSSEIIPVWRMGAPCSSDCASAYGPDTAPLIPAVAAVESLCITPQNNLLFLCRHDHRRIHILDADNGHYLQTIGLPIPASVPLSAQVADSVASLRSGSTSEAVDGPTAPRLACTPDSGFILVDKTRCALDMYDPEGNHVDSVFAPSPTAAVFGPDFNVYVSCAHDHAIRRFSFSYRPPHSAD